MKTLKYKIYKILFKDMVDKIDDDGPTNGRKKLVQALKMVEVVLVMQAWKSC